ncbi:neuroblastoma breakpoint family member 4-like [Bos javanicus]|uniref:neuroblastoma breakpoint family member 4-like n=1 Tax=Bos javanicus TaxID=9906 RepID=UPI002AA8A9E8|nr:neuroblastoma breakpoint family member 4-like [Bos javanicus]
MDKCSVVHGHTHFTHHPGQNSPSLEINQELWLHLVNNNQDFQDLTEKFLISQATANPLANQLQKYAVTTAARPASPEAVSLSSECEPCKDNVESVLGEKLPFEALRPAEKPTLDERLRTCDTLNRSQARELTQLRQTLRDGKDDSVLLKQHLEDLLTRNDPDSHQGQGFRESLSEGYRLAKRLACKLSPEIHENEEDEQGQETLMPSVNLHDVEKKEALQQSQDECVSVPSTVQEDSACNQPYRDAKSAYEEEKVGFALDGACGCSQAKKDEIDLSENQNDHDDLKGPEAISLRSTAVSPLEEEDVSYARDVTSEYYHVIELHLDAQYWVLLMGRDIRNACLVGLIKSKLPLVLLNPLLLSGDTWEDCHRGSVSFPGSEVPTSQTQLQKSTHVTDCLQWQLDQHFDCGDSKAMLGLSSTNGGFTSNPDSGNQGPLFLELSLDASIGMKNPPKLEDKGSTA